MKTTKIFAAMLAVLGFSACEPEEELKPGCPPSDGPMFMYGVVPCAYEQKDNVPDAKEIGDYALDETEIFIEENESE